MLPRKKNDFALPNKQETHCSEESSRKLMTLVKSLKNTSVIKIKIIVGGAEKTIHVPLSAVKLLADILTQMSEGNAVALAPIHAELTTQEAADLLNVSRPYLVALLEKHKIPYRKVGSRRKVLMQDILTYKKNIDTQREKVLSDLAKQSQELDLGYE